MLRVPIRHHRNTRIQLYDVPPDGLKPLPITSALRNKGDVEIVIPCKKPRDTLSILRKLLASVEKNPTAGHFMYMDDPYTLPTDNMSRRNYALSKASGRKVARFMINKYPRYVENVTASHPHVPSLTPESSDYKTQEPSEATLREAIKRSDVEHAYRVYREMKRNGEAPADTTHLALLDLLCVYNSADPPEPLDPEEFWFRKELEQGEFSKTQPWQINGAAEKVFDDLGVKSAAAYNTMIRGCAHYRQNEKSMQYYRFAKDNGMQIERGTYEKLLCACHYHLDSYEDKLTAIRDMLEDYAAAGHPATLAVCNAAFTAASELYRSPVTRAFCLQLLAEMRRCDIEPSLGTWHCVLRCFYPNTNAQGGILYEVVEELEKASISLRHPSDIEFFFTAMSRCTKNLHDVELAYRIDALLNSGDMNQLHGNAFHQTVYYALLFRLVCSVDTWDNIMLLYSRLVPHIFLPNPTDMIEFLQALGLNDQHDSIPMIFTDMVVFGFHKKPDVLAHLLRLMTKKLQSPELQKAFGEIAREIRKIHEAESASNAKSRLRFQGNILGDLVLLSCRVSDLDLSWYFMSMYDKHRREYHEYPSEQSLKSMIDLCIEKREKIKALTCLSLMADLSLPTTPDVARLIYDSFTLDATDREKVDVLLVQ